MLQGGQVDLRGQCGEGTGRSSRPPFSPTGQTGSPRALAAAHDRAVRKTAAHGERRPVNTTVTVALAVGARRRAGLSRRPAPGDRLGLPSLLLYLASACPRRGRPRHPLRRRRTDPEPRLRRAGRDPRRGRADHPLERRRARCSAGRRSLATVGVVVSVVVVARGRRTGAGRWTGGSRCSRRRALLDRRRRRLLGAAPAAAAAAGWPATLEAESGFNDAPA